MPPPSVRRSRTRDAAILGIASWSAAATAAATSTTISAISTLAASHRAEVESAPVERRLTRTGIVATVFVVALAGAASAPASPYVHAHRGGSLATVGGEQRPVYPESSLPAYRESARRGFVLELDVKLTADRVPVVIHDATLERTTDCEGRVDSLTFAQLRSRCELDTLGTEGAERPLDPGDERRAAVPSLRQVLKLARERGSEINLEIKNIPADPDYDPTPGYATTVAEAIKASAFPPGRLIVQSFLPQNLGVIENDPYFERAETSFLTLKSLEGAGPAIADGSGFEWVSPQWPVDQGYVSEAHALGLRVAPFTIDDATELRAATRAGVDAVITNDPRLARRVDPRRLPEAAQTAPAADPSPVPSRRSERAGPSDRELPSRRLGPARVRDPVQAGPRERRHLRGLPDEDRVPDPRVREAADGGRPPQRRRPDRGRRADDPGHRQPRRADPRPLRRPGEHPRLRGRGGAVRGGRRARQPRRRLLAAARRLRGPLSRRAAGPRAQLRRRHRHLRARLDADLQRPRQALRRLHPRLQQPGGVPRVDRSDRGVGLRRPRRPRRADGVRRHRSRGLQRGLHVGARRRHQGGPGAAPQRRHQQPEGAADRDRERARADPRGAQRPRRGREPRALPAARHEGEDLLRHEPARVRLRRRPGDPIRAGAGPRDRPLLGHRPLLHALHGEARRQHRHAGRGEPGRLGQPGRRQRRRVAAAGVDELDLALLHRPDGLVRLQRHARSWSATSPT